MNNFSKVEEKWIDFLQGPDIDYTISKFSNDIDINSLYYYMKNNIDPSKKVIFGFLDNFLFL